jgi:dethiobiotin synthetase
MIPGLFITGTDTGVGKTIVTAGILHTLRQRGMDAAPMKPVQSGGVFQGGAWRAPDLDYSLRVAGMADPQAARSRMAPYVYEPACSPHLAARMAGETPSITHIVDCARQLEKRHDLVLAEGAGGILVPLNEDDLMLDLMKALAYPVLLVARAGLGTINHTLLSVECLRRAGLEIFGVVFCETECIAPENRFIADDNPKAVAHFGDVDILGTVGYTANLQEDSKAFWDAFSDSISLAKLGI